MGYGWSFADGDWARLRQIVQKIASINLGPDSTPIFAGLTLTGDLDVDGGVDIGGDATIGGDLTLSGLTASRLMATDAGKSVVSSDLYSWVTQTANQVLIADDGDGTITFSTPQDIHTGATPAFAGVNAGTLSITSGSITDSSGAISFGDEDLTTTGDVTTNRLRLTLGLQDYLFCDGVAADVAFQSQTSGQTFLFRFFSKDGDGTDSVVANYFGVGTPSSITNAEWLAVGWFAGTSQYRILTYSLGSGTVRPLSIFTNPNTDQLLLNTDGSVNMNTGDLMIPNGEIVLGDTALYDDGDFNVESLGRISFQCLDGEFDFVGDGDNLAFNFYTDTVIGVFAWLEDEDRFQFYDDIFMSTGEAVMFEATTTKLQYGNTGDLDVYTPANKTLELQTAVYKDINIPGALLVGNPTQVPGTDQFVDSTGTDTGIETYAFDIDEGVHGGFELQHDYKEGTDLVFHVHWQGIAAPSGTDNVQWRLTYVVARDDTVLAAATTIDSPDTAIDTQYKCYRTDFAAITGTNFKIGDQFMFSLERVDATGDAYAGDALIFTGGIHYQCDTIGSRQIGTK